MLFRGALHRTESPEGLACIALLRSAGSMK